MNEESSMVFVIDDNASMRNALTRLIQSVGLAVRTFASPQEFMASEHGDVPSCLVLDVRLPGISGLDFQRKLTEAGIGFPVIFITGHGDIAMSVRAMKAGAVEFLTKPFRDQDLLDSIYQALDRDRARRLREVEIAQLNEKLASLTPREKEVLPLAVSGFLNKQIASTLGTTEGTVKVHRSQILRKMAASSFAELVRMAEKLGIPSHAA
jgi:RNA polymerase sigma factor (sigma-70 family)